MNLFDFYKNKRVLVTGHTGFKGSWMCEALLMMGADVTGYALPPMASGEAALGHSGAEALFDKLSLPGRMKSVIGDIRDLDKLRRTFEEIQPEIVIHMAAQPIVRESYKDPVGTYSTNVMGTVNVLECVRLTPSVRSFVNVTTDKVYRNEEREAGYHEDEYLDGYDPYSNSKSCSELVTSSYKNSFFDIDKDMVGTEGLDADGGSRFCAISTCRAGNVIGGGDYAPDRIIPDCIRAAAKGQEIVVRNPSSTRPYQHVLEPVLAYLMVAARQYEEPHLQGAYNVGPDDEDCVTTGELTELFCKKWDGAAWISRPDGGPHEAGFLKLDSSKIKSVFGWHPIWHIDTVMDKIVEWTLADFSGEDMAEVTREQIREYLEG